MEANELRIGNYIHHSTDDVNSIIEVFAVSNDEINFKIPIENCKGIILTDEWALKIGFEINYDKALPYQKAFLHVEEGIILNDKFQITIEGTEGDLHIIGNELKYVHQLQNLYFALTGNELKSI